MSAPSSLKLKSGSVTPHELLCMVVSENLEVYFNGRRLTMGETNMRLNAPDLVGPGERVKFNRLDQTINLLNARAKYQP